MSLYRILSLCCGAGGLDQGLKEVGLETTLAVDYDPKRLKYSQDCLETIKLNHPNTETLWGNILDHEDSFGRYDIVVGGVPCPEFSNAKTDKSYDDTLVKCFWRIVQKTGAKYWLLENVPGIIKVCKLRNFLINCADYGTPQKRVRRFYTNLPRPPTTHAKKARATLDGHVEKWVSVRDALCLENGIFYLTKNAFDSQNGKELSKSIDEPSPTVVIGNTFELTDHKIYSTKYIQEKNKSYDARNYFHEIDNPSRTIMTKDLGLQPSMMVSDGKYVRKLTLKECATLQGFPKDYKFFGGKTSRRRQIGNAVPSQPIKALFSVLS